MVASVCCALAVYGGASVASAGSVHVYDPGTVVHYTVQPGDTLWSIAQRSVGEDGDVAQTVEYLRQINKLDSSSLRSGQHLLIPAE